VAMEINHITRVKAVTADLKAEYKRVMTSRQSDEKRGESNRTTDAKFRTGKLTIAENLLLNLIKRGKACVIPRLSTNTATFS